MKRVALLLAILLLVGCASTSLDRNKEEARKPAKSPLLASAAAPFAVGDTLATSEQMLEKARTELQEQDLLMSPSFSKEFRVQNPDYVFVCGYSPSSKGMEVPLLACKFGEFVNTVTGHALFWLEEGYWKSSYYPQTTEGLTRTRQTYFRNLGENCPIGCAGGFKALRQEGNRLLAVVDLSSVASRSNEEVHLLERDKVKGTWSILWVPTPETYSFKGHPKVILPERGMDQFKVTYDDGRSETWVLQGTQFVKQ